MTTNGEISAPASCTGNLVGADTEPGPVRRVPATESADGVERWLVTRYADVRAALANPRLSNTRAYTGGSGGSHDAGGLSHTMIAVDPPDHTRLRKLVVRAFSANRVEALRPRVQEIADELLDAAGSRDDVDVLKALAFPLPVRVIAEVLGIPSEVRDRLLAETGAGSMVPMDAVAAELTALIDARRTDPADDLLTELVAAHRDQKLTDVELVQMGGILFAAGHVTTVHLILGSVLTLLRHPDQLAELRRNPALVAHAVDEQLRHVGPVPAVGRYALDEVEIGGVTIPKGSHVTVALATANHDPYAFTAPDTFDVRRGGTQDVAFGHGIHFCLGARLAKLEAEVAIGTLLRRFPDLTLADHQQDGAASTLGAAHPLHVHLRPQR